MYVPGYIPVTSSDCSDRRLHNPRDVMALFLGFGPSRLSAKGPVNIYWGVGTGANFQLKKSLCPIRMNSKKCSCPTSDE